MTEGGVVVYERRGEIGRRKRTEEREPPSGQGKFGSGVVIR